MEINHRNQRKKILSFDNKIKIPHFVTVKKKQGKQSFDSIHFPAIVKPLNLEASEGISQSSYVKNEKISAGYKATVGDLQIDATLENQLNQFKKQVLNN